MYSFTSQPLGPDIPIEIFNKTPAFFQRLLGEQIPSSETCEKISRALADKSLLACSNGSCIDGSGSHGWVIAHDSGDVIAQGSGPTDGHPLLVSSFQAELGGLLAVLHVIHRVCQYYHVQEGKARLFYDNKGALTHVFYK